MYGKAQIPQTLWMVIIAALVVTLIVSPNILVMIPLLLYIPFIYRLFFLKGDTNVMFWGLMYQWLNVSAHVMYATVSGVTLNSLFFQTIFPSELIEFTTFLSIIGMYVFCFGVFLAVKKVKVALPETIWDRYDPKKMLQVYVLVSVFINVYQAAIWNFPTLVQYFYFFFYVKWGFFLVTFLAIFKRAPYLKIFLLLVIFVEFLLGLSSFFASSFSYILMYGLIGFSAVSKKISFAKGILFVVFGGLLFHMAVLWTAAKGNYRSFVSQGDNVQTVKVSKDQARSKLLELVVKVDKETYKGALEDLVNRVGYVQYFSAAVRFVPAKMPFEDGKVYLTAMAHYLVPRFINPDKAELDDSKHTNKYTGLNVSGKSRASSFSLGSYADAYIDFGPIFMVVPIFLFGFLIGSFFKYLYKPGLWGMIFTSPFFLLINIYGADTAKALGFVLIYFLVMFFVNKTLKSFMDPRMRPDVKL